MEDEVLAVEARRVETWLNQNGITSLADFAFWYSSFEEALDDAGRAVATAWQRARQDSSLGIAGLVRQLFEQERAARNRPVEPMAPPPRPGPSQAVAAPVPAIVLAKPSRSRRLAAAPLAEPVGDRNQDLVHQLMSILLAAGTHRPSDGQGDSMVRANFGDMASRICNRSERATITKALTTWSELREFARQRGSTVGALNAHELGHFTRGHRFAQRALVALRWMVRNMPLTYDLALVQQPAAQSGQRFGVGASQAPVAPPLLVWQLNDLLEGNVNESAWTALGAWMMIFGVVRYAHLQRSILTRSDSVAMYFYCFRGKQHGLREGFYWTCPRHTFTGFDLLPPLLRHLEALGGADDKFRGRLVFDSAKKEAWAMGPFLRYLKDVFRILLTNPQDLSSYSFRRVSPTLASLAQMSEESRLALGNWTDKSSGSGIAFRYSDAKSRLALQVKMALVKLVSRLGSSLGSWQDVSMGKLLCMIRCSGRTRSIRPYV